MAGLVGILYVGTKALDASRYGVSTVSQNIANVNTPGYHRRESLQQTESPVFTGNFYEPMGVRVMGTRQVINNTLESHVRNGHSDAAGSDARANVLGRANALFGDIFGGGLSRGLDDLFASFDALAANPGDRSARNEVLAAASSFASQMNGYAEDVINLRTSLNPEMDAVVADINRLTSEIASVNNEIQGATVPPEDLIDRRAGLLDELSKQIGIRVLHKEDGGVDVSLANGFNIVVGDRTHALTAQPDANGYNEIWGSDGGGAHNLSSVITGGRLGGTLASKSDLESLSTSLDNFAFETANAVNTVHAAGFGLDGLGGRNLFNVSGTAPDAARTLSVDAAVAGDPDAIAAATLATDVPGGNGNASALMALREATLPSGETPADMLQSALQDFGNRIHAAETASETNGRKVEQLVSLRDSIIGVSVDEEMTSLMKFRQTYAAAAQIIRTADSLLEEVISLKR